MHRQYLCITVCCSVLQCVAVCCNVLQCVAVWCIVELEGLACWDVIRNQCSLLGRAKQQKTSYFQFYLQRYSWKKHSSSAKTWASPQTCLLHSNGEYPDKWVYINWLSALDRFLWLNWAGGSPSKIEEKKELKYVAVCCSVLQCVVVFCGVIQCDAQRMEERQCCSMSQCFAWCRSVLQCFKVCCSVLWCDPSWCRAWRCDEGCYLCCIAVHCSAM